MTNELKNQLQKLLEQYPELKDSSLSFTGTDIDFKPAKQTTDVGTQTTASNNIANQTGALVSDIIAGHSSKVEIRKSPVHGYGVFAKETIDTGELIEECRLLKLGHRANYNHDPVLKDYVWAGKDDGEQKALHGAIQYMALGLGAIYNHADQPNTTQNLDFKTEIMTVKAGQTILKNEEIFVSYGKKYFMIRNFWKNVQKNNELEGFINKQLNTEPQR